MSTRADAIIKLLKLNPHPEGGWFRETFRSGIIINKDALSAVFPADHNAVTSIYYLLTLNNFSAFHRLKCDEIWHHYEGGVVSIHIISPDGEYELIKLGKLSDDTLPQAVIRAGCWFAAGIADGSEFALVGCDVAPGFEFTDFELGIRKELIKKFPLHEQILNRLTR